MNAINLGCLISSFFLLLQKYMETTKDVYFKRDLSTGFGQCIAEALANMSCRNASVLLRGTEHIQLHNDEIAVYNSLNPLMHGYK